MREMCDCTTMYIQQEALEGHLFSYIHIYRNFHFYFIHNQLSTRLGLGVGGGDSFVDSKLNSFPETVLSVFLACRRICYIVLMIRNSAAQNSRVVFSGIILVSFAKIKLFCFQRHGCRRAVGTRPTPSPCIRTQPFYFRTVGSSPPSADTSACRSRSYSMKYAKSLLPGC